MQLFSSWTGSEFLINYSALLALASLAAWWIPTRLRGVGRQGDSHDLESVALLAGGRERFAQALLADLWVRGGIELLDHKRLMVAQRQLSASPAGQAVLGAAAPMMLADAQRLINGHAERVAARLRRSGLMLWPEDFARLRWISITPYAAIFLIGLYRQRADAALNEPTDILVVLLGLTAALAVIRFVKSDPRTASGIEAVRRLRDQNELGARLPRPDEAALAVALFGTGVLVGTPWEGINAMRRNDAQSRSLASVVAEAEPQA